MIEQPMSASFFDLDLTNGWNTFSNAGLYFLRQGLIIESPEPDIYLVDVPGRDAPLDLTEALLAGYVHYKTRNITMKLAAVQQNGKPEIHFANLFSALRNKLHGKRLLCIISDDDDYYWEGRWKVECQQLDSRKATITISGICDPYKISVTTGEKRL